MHLSLIYNTEFISFWNKYAAKLSYTVKLYIFYRGNKWLPTMYKIYGLVYQPTNNTMQW